MVTPSLNLKTHVMQTMQFEKWTTALWMESALLLNMLEVQHEEEIEIEREEEEIEEETEIEIEREEEEIEIEIEIDHLQEVLQVKDVASIAVEMATGQEIVQMRAEGWSINNLLPLCTLVFV